MPSVFSASRYAAMYRKFMGPLAGPVELLINNSGTYTGYNTTAHVTKYQESDLVPGGSIQLGDLKVIILAEDLDAFGITKMGLADRINIDGLSYAIVNWDNYTRSVGENTIAVEVAVRGGGVAVIASINVYRITDTGDRRITSNGDYRITKEAV